MCGFDINKIYQLPNKRDEFFCNYDVKLPVILYGCGKGCATALDMLITNGITPIAICDTDESKWGGIFHKIPVTSIQNIKNKYNDFYIFIAAPVYAREIIDYVKSFIKRERIYFFGNFTEQIAHRNYTNKNITFIKKLYSQLTDDKSRITLINMLKGWITCDYKYFQDIFTSEQYFTEEIMKLSDNESYVDVGAYTGDTIIKFIEKVNAKYNNIYAFEPNEQCFSSLIEIENNYDKLKIIKKGAYECKTTFGFNANSNSMSSAHLVNDNTQTCTIDVDRIDNQIKNKVTFIKMDIEGAELSALKGARKTILENKPKLAICVYHKYEDIIEIPKFIMSLGLSYNYYLRHHSYYSGETVFYAV